VLLIVVVFVGPATSGALLLLLPAPQRSAPQGLSENYTPVHKGHVSLDIGLYFRENEDLVVPGTPGIVLRRSYASSYRASREFGVGTTLVSEWSVIGDGKQFQWAELVRPGESRVRFERTSAGTSVSNAMFVHHGSPGEWEGARLGWTGVDWALRRVDGTLARFRACGPHENSRCSVVSYRDADGAFDPPPSQHGWTTRASGEWTGSMDRLRLRRARSCRARLCQHEARAALRIRRSWPPGAGQVRRCGDAPLHLHRSGRDGHDRRAGVAPGSSTQPCRYESTSSRCPRSPIASARPTTINSWSISRSWAGAGAESTWRSSGEGQWSISREMLSYCSLSS